MISIDIHTARRFILGKQGLWPGRRWRGSAGTEQAMRAMEYLQLDPLQIIARSQDLALHSRVIDYTPGMWEELAYGERKFFDWGGWLAVRPMDELPYWRVVMRHERDGEPYLQAMAQEHADAIAEMRQILNERGVVSNRDFSMSTRKRTQSYRGRKDSSLALYYLWRTGEVMIHHRENFERFYALTEAVAPARLIREADEPEAARFLLKKEISFSGLARLSRTSDFTLRGIHFDGTRFPKVQQVLAELQASGDVVEVRVEGWRTSHWALAGDAGILNDLAAGRVPEEWKPLETTTEEEAIFLAPLDPVNARGRAKVLFNFEYVWEVYKPERQRKFGYYVLPILWGDRLVGRFDSKLERSSRTLVITGLWLEDDALGQNDAFAESLARGYDRFLRFLGADRVDAKAMPDARLRHRIATIQRT